MEATDNNDNNNGADFHDHLCSPEDMREAVEVNWSMFEICKELGGGAFGRVYKVKCLASTKVCDQGGERVVMRSKSIRQTKAQAIKQRVQQTMSKNNSNTEGRYLLQDEYYVIKAIDVAEVPEKVGLEALNEIEIMGSLDSPYIVGYIDSFIADQKIHIVLEYCPVGDLNSLVEKQKLLGGTVTKPFVDNVIWKIFIHICLGLQYLHSRNIIHRDLKSLNIFMVKESYAKVGDLGCFKYYDPEEAAEAEKKQAQEGRKGSENAAEPEQKPTNTEQGATEKPKEDDDMVFQQALEGNAKQEEMRRMDSLFKQASSDSAPFDKLEDKLLDDIEGDDLMLTELDQGQMLVDGLGLQSKSSVQSPDPQVLGAGGETKENPDQIKDAAKVEEAKAEEEDLEVSRVGTPFYLAPELWKNPKYSPASDIWALGVILYEICCLGYPFPATEMEELENKVLNDKIAKHPNFVCQDFVNLFQKMLNKNPAKRPCIETIIFSDIFQTKAQQNHITLPLILNKQKLQDKFSLGQLGGVELTEKQKRLAGILYPSKIVKNKTEPPSVRYSQLNKNLNNKKDANPAKNDKEHSPQKKPMPAAQKELKKPERLNPIGKKEPAQPPSTKNQSERGDAMIFEEKDESKAKTDNVYGKQGAEKANISANIRSASGTLRKQPAQPPIEKELDKDIQQRRNIAVGSRFVSSRQSVASNVTNKTKGEDSPQKKEPAKPVAKRFGQQKSPGQFDLGSQKNSDGLINPQRVEDKKETTSTTNEKAGARFKGPARSTTIVVPDEQVAQSAPVSIKNSHLKTRPLTSNKFSSNLDRTNNSAKDDAKTKTASDPKAPTQLKGAKGNLGNAITGTNKQPPNTSRNLKSSQELDRQTSSDQIQIPQRNSAGTVVGKFQSQLPQGTRTSHGMRTVENKFGIDGKVSAADEAAGPGGAEKARGVLAPFKKRLSRQSDNRQALGALNQNHSQKGSDSKALIEPRQPSGSVASNHNEDVVVEPVDKVDIEEKEEEHVKSLAEVLFADEINEQQQKANPISQKAQSDQIALRGANLAKESSEESARPTLNTMKEIPSSKLNDSKVLAEEKQADNQKDSNASQAKLTKQSSQTSSTSLLKSQAGSKTGSRLVTPSASASVSAPGGLSKFRSNRLGTITEMPGSKKDIQGAAASNESQTQRSQASTPSAQNIERQNSRNHPGQKYGIGGTQSKRETNSQVSNTSQSIKEPSSQGSGQLGQGLQRRTIAQRQQPLKKQQSTVSSKATDRVSVASSEKGAMKSGPAGGIGAPLRRKNPETTQNISQGLVQSKSNAEQVKEKAQAINTAPNKRLEKKPMLKFGESKPGASTSRTTGLAKRTTNTAQPDEGSKLADPSSSDAGISEMRSKPGVLPGLKRTTTQQKIGTGSSMINSPEAPKTEKSLNPPKGPGIKDSANAQQDKRRQTIASPAQMKKSDSKSSDFKMSAPGSITNSSNQQPMKFHSSQKPSPNINFSNAKQSNNNTSKKIDTAGPKKGETDSKKQIGSLRKNIGQSSEFEGSSLQIAQNDSSPSRLQLLNDSSIDNEETLRKAKIEMVKTDSNQSVPSSSQGQALKEPKITRTFQERQAEKRLAQKYRTTDVQQKPSDQDQIEDQPPEQVNKSESDPKKLQNNIIEEQPQESDIPFDKANTSSNMSNHELNASMSSSQMNNSQLIQRRGTAARKFQPKSNNYVASNVNKPVADAKLGSMQLEEQEKQDPLLDTSMKALDTSVKSISKGNSFQTFHKRNSQNNRSIDAGHEGIFMVNKETMPPKKSQSPVASAQAGPDDSFSSSGQGQRRTTFVRFRQRIDEKRRLNSSAGVVTTATNQIIEDSKEDPQNFVAQLLQNNNGHDIKDYVFEDDEGNQQMEKVEEPYAPVQVQQQLPADDQQHQGGLGAAQSKKQNGHSIIKEMGEEEENDQK